CQRFAWQDHRRVAASSGWLARAVLVRPWRCVLGRWQLAAEPPFATSVTPLPAPPSAAPKIAAAAPAPAPAASPVATAATMAGSAAVLVSPAIRNRGVIGRRVCCRRVRRCGCCGRLRVSVVFFGRRALGWPPAAAEIALAPRRLHVRGLRRRRRGAIGSEHRTALLLHLFHFFFDGRYDVLELLDFFEEVRNVEEGVAIEPDLHEGRLHAWQHARHTAFVDASD